MTRQSAAAALGIGVLAYDKLVRAGLTGNDGTVERSDAVAALAAEPSLHPAAVAAQLTRPALVVQVGPGQPVGPGDPDAAWRTARGWSVPSGPGAVDALRGDWPVPRRRDLGDPAWIVATIAGFVVDALAVTGEPEVVGGWCRYPARLAGPQTDPELFAALAQPDAPSPQGRRLTGRLPAVRGPLAWRLDPNG